MNKIINCPRTRCSSRPVWVADKKQTAVDTIETVLIWRRELTKPYQKSKLSKSRRKLSKTYNTYNNRTLPCSLKEVRHIKALTHPRNTKKRAARTIRSLLRSGSPIWASDRTSWTFQWSAKAMRRTTCCHLVVVQVMELVELMWKRRNDRRELRSLSDHIEWCLLRKMIRFCIQQTKLKKMIQKNPISRQRKANPQPSLCWGISNEQSNVMDTLLWAATIRPKIQSKCSRYSVQAPSMRWSNTKRWTCSGSSSHSRSNLQTGTTSLVTSMKKWKSIMVAYRWQALGT